jgi:hypothetical protein
MSVNDGLLDAALYSAFILSRPYFSIWRILHIDGFEPMYPRPVKYKFMPPRLVGRASSYSPQKLDI